MTKDQTLSIVSRVAAAMIGGYAVSYYAAAAMSVLLPMVRSEAVVTSILLGIVIFAAAIMWVFSASSAKQAWLVLLVLTVILAAVAYLPGLLS